MNPHVTNYAVMIVVMVFIAWRRINRTFGRQPVRRKRLLGRAVILGAVACAVTVACALRPLLLEGWLAGALGGVALGVTGLRLTRFERDADGADAYIPNPWIGGLLTVLLVARLGYRFLVAAPQLQDAASSYHGPAIGNSPLTLALAGLTIGYYVAYCAGLLVHHRRFEQAQQAPQQGS